ncbi:HEAT repeat domain-containing protein [Effusibacillus consociatus]|uniref:SEC-C metal-binding domain-containing protein n=1 Tax=Effusibacillus consociatus TaxID=1117041 RepID=A0ABV9Q6I1_9BACL
MLTFNEVKPLLLHEDKDVVNDALQYFADSYLYDEELLPLFLRRFQSDPEGLYLHYIKHFPQTPETLNFIFKWMREHDVFKYPNQFAHFSVAVSHSDLSLLEGYKDQPPAILKECQKTIQQRYELSQTDTSVLWDKLHEVIDSGFEKYITDFDSAYGDLIVEELAKRADVDADRVLAELNKEYPETHWGYEQHFFAQLAGKLRLESAVPRLVGFLADEFLSEAAIDALSRIQSKKSVELMEERFFEGDWEFRLSAAHLLGRIKLPETEQALARLYPQAEEEDIATLLADGFCKLFSKERIPLVQEMVHHGYEEWVLDLEQSLYVNCLANGVVIPELDEYKRKREDREAREKREDSGPSGLLERTNRLGLPASTPYVNPNKIGRNDPCPCGSGKKYKKCCLG